MDDNKCQLRLVCDGADLTARREVIPKAESCVACAEQLVRLEEFSKSVEPKKKPGWWRGAKAPGPGTMRRC